MLLFGEGLILLYVCYTEPTASPPGGKIIQCLWTVRPNSPLVSSAVKKRYWSSNDCFLSGLCVFCCLRSIYRRTVVLSWIMWTNVTGYGRGGVIQTYSSSIYVNKWTGVFFFYMERLYLWFQELEMCKPARRKLVQAFVSDDPGSKPDKKYARRREK